MICLLKVTFLRVGEVFKLRTRSRKRLRLPQVALLVPKVRVVVGQVVEGAEVQVADLHHPCEAIQRLRGRLSLACTARRLLSPGESCGAGAGCHMQVATSY